MSERRECFCGRRTVFEFGLTDDDGNAHTWRFCGKDDDGQGLDVNTLLSEQMEAHERAWQAEAAIARVRELHVEGPHQTCMVCATWKTWADGRTDLLGEPWPCSTIRALGGDGDE